MSFKKLFNKASGAIAGISMLALAGCQMNITEFETKLTNYGEPFPSHVFDVNALQRIAGEEDRLKVLPKGSFARVGRIIVGPGGYGTGVLVGPNIVMTADHVTESDSGRTYAPSQLTFHAGYSDGKAVASSRVVAVIAPATSVLGGVKNNAQHSFNDVAFLVLEDNLGDQLGYETIARSYPKPEANGRYLGAVVGNNRNHTQMTTGDFQCSYTKGFPDRRVLNFNCDVDRGDSGGPLYSWRFNAASGTYQREIVGVVSTRDRTGGTAYSVVGSAVPRLR